MSTYNNFDKSSTGINIETNLHYSNFEHQLNIDDNFERLDRNHLFYNPCHGLDTARIYLDVVATKKDLIEFLSYEKSKSELNKLNKDELKEEFWEHIAIYYDLSCELRWLPSLLYEFDGNGDYNINFKTDKGHSIELHTVNDYGDYYTVITIPEMVSEIYGSKVTYDEIAKDIKYLIQVTPISGTININDNEIYYNDLYLDNEYYDKNDLINEILKLNSLKELNPELLKEQLELTLPDDLDFNY